MKLALSNLTLIPSYVISIPRIALWPLPELTMYSLTKEHNPKLRIWAVTTTTIIHHQLRGIPRTFPLPEQVLQELLVFACGLRVRYPSRDRSQALNNHADMYHGTKYNGYSDSDYGVAPNNY